MSTEYVYLFQDADEKNKLKFGGKGANLAGMTKLGLPVPPGFTITTECCHYYDANNREFPTGIMDRARACVQEIEKHMGRKFGDPENPLLFSVRSGAPASMPGMMDTILNLGLTEKSREGLAKNSGNRHFALDSHRRFLQMFGDVVLGIEKKHFDRWLVQYKKDKGVEHDYQLTDAQLEEVIKAFQDVILKAGKQIPDDPYAQLELAIKAVFESWNNPRAITYRTDNQIPQSWGTAVNVQAMVFGNMGEDSGTGVAFSRDPATGENKIQGEFLMNAQGEDVVAGIRTPMPIEELSEKNPEIAKQFFTIMKNLETHYKDMQDIEFTIEHGKLFILQTRNGKRTGFASIRIATDLVTEGLISETEALAQNRVQPSALNQLLHPIFNPVEKKKHASIAKGLAASPGAAVGKVAFTSDEAVERAAKGEKVILVSEETTPDDVKAFRVAQGILTARGGNTSHAAVVARQYGIPCVSGCGDLIIDEDNHTLKINNHDGVYTRESWISIDGYDGNVYGAAVPTKASEVMQVIEGTLKPEDAPIYKMFETYLGWADEHRRLDIRTNADVPAHVEHAYKFGARGIGLTRTEHMFMEAERLPWMQAMILSETEEERRKNLDELFKFQVVDFEGIFRAMHGCPVTIRLLDPPLHEFLPHDDEEINKVIKNYLGNKANDTDLRRLRDKVSSLHENNPMLGFRGCRLGVIYPEINEMQVRAILTAAIKVKKSGNEVKPEIMIPLTSTVEELKLIKARLESVVKKLFKDEGIEIPYMFGTMIEIPRAALTAGEIAEVAEFFSFGTNDLTQMTLGLSRDDAENTFLTKYVAMGVYPFNPFEQLDTIGVGRLVEIAVKEGKAKRPNLKVGICGEHGGEPYSIHFCEKVGLNYVSCSPARVPIARLAAAQAAIEQGTSKK